MFADLNKKVSYRKQVARQSAFV